MNDGEIQWRGGRREAWFADPKPFGSRLCAELDTTNPDDPANELCGTPVDDGPCGEHHPDPLLEAILKQWWDSPLWFSFGVGDLAQTLGGPDQARKMAARQAVEVFRRFHPTFSQPQLLKVPHDLAGIVAQPPLAHLVHDLAPAAGALFSPCGDYRYALTREWGTGPTAVYFMLNPSTADALADDATITRCIGFAQREHCGALVVVNAFALRSRDPGKLRGHLNPVGDDNDQVIRMVLAAAAADGGPVIAAWGANPFLARSGRTSDLAGMLAEAGVKPRCLKISQGGQPEHPLYQKNSAPLIPYTLPQEAK